MLSRKAAFAPIDLAHVVEKDIRIHSATIRPNGTPLIQLTNGEAYAYNVETQVFESVCSLWHAEHSSYWTRTRASSSNPKNIVAYLETNLNTLRPDIVAAAEAAGAKAKPRWFDDAIPLGHLEARLQACALLNSPNEYKMFLTSYAKKIADEGYRNKAEQLAKDLYGPISL
jgi:protein HIRA/HIR1